jgi:hypothetical protein
MLTARMQTGLYYARRNRRSRAIVAALTQWRSGLVVTAGHYLQNNGVAYKVLVGGTTGSHGPTQTHGDFTDSNNVEFQYANQIFVTPPLSP